MRANSTQINLNCDRQKDYQRQQERLKTLPSTADKVKPVSPDVIIENLLRDTRMKNSQMSLPGDSFKHHHFDIPPWLQCDSSLVPENYQFLWSLVQSSVDMADTQKVSQLLLTSGLHVDVLGFIWNLANKTIPGKLTKQEFFIVLALITLAQTGYAFNNLSVLKLISAPIPSPTLQINVFKKFLPHSNVNTPSDNSNLSVQQIFHNSKIQEPLPLSCVVDPIKVNVTHEIYRPSSSSYDAVTTFEDGKSKPSNVNSNYNCDTEKLCDVNVPKENSEFLKNTNFPCIGSSPTAELEDEFSDFQSVPAAETAKDPREDVSIDPDDDFTEFQTGSNEPVDPFETVVISQRKEIPKIPLPKAFTASARGPGLKSDILKISPESERKLKVLSQSESLSSLPESKISSTNKVFTSISVLGSNHDIGSRLANHSLNVKLDKPKLHKHHKIKINSTTSSNQSAGEGEIIFGVKTSNLEHAIPKCCPKKSNNGKTFLLKETKITSENSSEPEADLVSSGEVTQPGKNTRKIEIPLLGIFNETVLPTQSQSQPQPQAPSTIDFMSVQEDKYSALRDIELYSNHESTIIEKRTEKNDEFGDFLSADISQPPFPISTAFDKHSHSAVPDLNLPIDGGKTIEELKPTNDDNEVWSDWNFSVDTKPEAISSTLSNFTNTNESLMLNDKPAATSDVFDSFDLLGEEDVIMSQTYIPVAVPSQNDILTAVDSDCVLNVNTLSPIKESSKATNEEFDSKLSDTSNFDLFSLQAALPQPNDTNQTDSETWDFFSFPPRPLTTATLTRHGSLPSLDLKMPVSEESEQEVIWRKCYESCRNIIQEASEIFASVSKKSVMDEIFANPKTYQYLSDLNIAYHIINRIKENSNEAFTNQDDLDNQWRRLKELCFEYNIKLKEEVHCSSEEKHLCSICLGPIGEDLHSQNNQNYHLSCANLWINCVEETLPTPT